MAQKRMIDKKISVSEDVANLTVEAQLLFTWMIVHADDVGLLPYTSRSIKALIVPMVDILSVESIGNHLETMEKQKLIETFEWEGDKYWRIVNFHNHQTLKSDRKPQTIAKNISSWKTVESIWKTLEDKGTEVSKKESKGYSKFLESKKHIGHKI